VPGSVKKETPEGPSASPFSYFPAFFKIRRVQAYWEMRRL